jgi:hypothetical protein
MQINKKLYPYVRLIVIAWVAATVLVLATVVTVFWHIMHKMAQADQCFAKEVKATDKEINQASNDASRALNKTDDHVFQTLRTLQQQQSQADAATQSRLKQERSELLLDVHKVIQEEEKESKQRDAAFLKAMDAQAAKNEKNWHAFVARMNHQPSGLPVEATHAR